MESMAETFLITGASSGIGRELAWVAARNGHPLILVARRESVLNGIAAQIRDKHGVPTSTSARDLSLPDERERLYREVSDEGQQVGVLVNNAGYGAVGPFAELDTDRQLDMVELNVKALTHLCRLFLPSMIERGTGGIMNVASTAAFQPGPNMAVYYAGKSYVLSLTEAIAEELRGTGVRVSCLCPGATRTEFQHKSGAAHARLARLKTASAREVAEFGYRSLQASKVVAVQGLVNRLLALSVRFSPRWAVRRLIHVINS